MTAFEQDVEKAYTECGISPAPKGKWGNAAEKTACPMMAAYIAKNGDYPPATLKIGQWVLHHYKMSRDYGQGILCGYDYANSDVVASDEFRAGYQLGQKLAAKYRG